MLFQPKKWRVAKRTAYQRITAAFMAAFLLVTAFTFTGTGQAHAATVKADSGAQVIRESWKDARTLDLTVTSPSIDAWSKTVRLILPEGWTKDSAKTWPTLWLLHGGMGDYTDWTKNTDVAKQVAGRQVMVVMPDTSWCSAYSNWWNYGNYGKPAWDTYLTTELRQILERGYHANDKRAIAGPSMGGLGALKLPAQHVGMFSAAASFSGNADPLHSYNNTADGPDLPGLSCGADWKRVWGDYKIPEQKAIWQQNNPYDQADKLGSLQYLYIASGNGQADPLNTSWFKTDSVEQQVYTESRALVNKLQGLNIPVTSHFYDGRHDWRYWQVEFHNALPGLLNALDVPQQ